VRDLEEVVLTRVEVSVPCWVASGGALLGALLDQMMLAHSTDESRHLRAPSCGGGGGGGSSSGSSSGSSGGGGSGNRPRRRPPVFFTCKYLPIYDAWSGQHLRDCDGGEEAMDQVHTRACHSPTA
jgi:hypothetical protein